MAGELEFSEKLQVYKETPKEKEKISKFRAAFSLWPYRVLLLVFLWLELFFSAGCLITLFDLSVDIRLLFSIGAICGFVWFLFFSLHTGWRYLILAIFISVGVFCGFHYFDAMREGLLYLGKAFNQVFFNYYKTSLFHIKPSGEEKFCCAIFLGVLLQPVAVCYALSLFRARAKFASMGFLAFFSLIGLAVGLIPKPLFFIGAFFCALLQLAFAGASEYLVQGEKINKEYEDGQKRRAKIAFLFCVLAALICLPVLGFIDSDYSRSTAMREKKQQLQAEMERIVTMPVWKKIASAFRDFSPFSGGNKGDGTARIGGLNSGNFSRAAKIGFDNVTALFVTLPELNFPVYLRGYTGARYTEDGWKKLDEDAIREYEKIRERYGMSSQEQGYRLMDLIYHNKGPVLYEYGDLRDEAKVSRGEMKVEYVTANRDFVYTPYYINPFERGEYHCEQDGYLTSPTREESYDYTFLMPSLEFLYRFGELTDLKYKIVYSYIGYKWQVGMESSQYLQFSDAYRDFVYKYYTEIPEENRGVKELLPIADNAHIGQKIQVVQNVLSQYQYTLAPGEMPPDADFVNYFLFENKKGYCVHFASSAVLMLRSLGVPARYAEGYLITKEDIAGAEAVAAQTISECEELVGKVEGDEMVCKPPSTRIVLQKRVDVRDYTAHAWVEIYLEEIGWVPVEMTSGYMENSGISQRPEEIMQEVSQLPSPTPSPTREATPTPRPTNTPTPAPTIDETEEEDVFANTPEHSEILEESTIAPSSTQSPTPSIFQKENGTMPKPEHSAPFPLWAKILFAIASLFLCLFCFLLSRYKLVWKIRSRKKTRKRQVLWYYAQMERILHHMGLVPKEAESYEEFAGRVAKSGVGVALNFAGCQRTALMAGFGREHITKEQADFLAENYEKMRMELFGKAKGIQKYYLKFIKIY